jgi:hypothetical protein
MAGVSDVILRGFGLCASSPSQFHTFLRGLANSHIVSELMSMVTDHRVLGLMLMHTILTTIWRSRILPWPQRTIQFVHFVIMLVTARLTGCFLCHLFLLMLIYAVIRDKLDIIAFRWLRTALRIFSEALGRRKQSESQRVTSHKLIKR